MSCTQSIAELLKELHCGPSLRQKSPKTLSSGRDSVLLQLKQAALWRHLDITDILNSRVSWKSQSVKKDSKTSVDLKRQHTRALVFIDGCYCPEASSVDASVELSVHSGGKEEYLGFGAEKNRLNDAEIAKSAQIFAQAVEKHCKDTVEIRIKESGSYTICHVFQNEGLGCSMSRQRLVVEPGLNVSLNEHVDTHFAHVLLQNRSLEIQENATLCYQTSMHNAKHMRYFFHQSVLLAAKAQFKEQVVHTRVGFQHQYRMIHLRGEEACYDFSGVSVAFDNAKCNYVVHVAHHVPKAYSKQLHKSVVGDSASCAYHGLVYVEKHAQKTDSAQNNHHLLLDPRARSFSRPELEIYADDVQCQHGSTMGVLSEEVLVYLQSRGLSVCEARAMMLESFLAEGLACFSQEERSKTLQSVLQVDA